MPLLGRILRRMLLTTFGPTWTAALVVASLSLVPIMVAAAPIGPDTVVTVRSPVGFQFMTSWFDTVTSGIEITSVTPNSIKVGVFGLNGHVVGGDAVLAAFLDLGTAPLQKVVAPGTNLNDYIFVTPSSPLAGGVLNAAGTVSPPDFPGFEPGFPAGSGALGAEGTMYMGLAFLTEVNQPLSEVLGVRVPFQVRIGDTSGFIHGPDDNIVFFTDMSLGGAADFAAPTPEPITLVLFGTTAAGLGFARWRRKRNKQH
jgi:hypothetical protein